MTDSHLSLSDSLLLSDASVPPPSMSSNFRPVKGSTWFGTGSEGPTYGLVRATSLTFGTIGDVAFNWNKINRGLLIWKSCHFCVNPIKHFTHVNYESRVVTISCTIFLVFYWSGCLLALCESDFCNILYEQRWLNWAEINKKILSFAWYRFAVLETANV